MGVSNDLYNLCHHNSETLFHSYFECNKIQHVQRFCKSGLEYTYPHENIVLNGQTVALDITDSNKYRGFLSQIYSVEK